MSSITTHVLDTAHGIPAVGIPVSLYMQAGKGWEQVGQEVTNRDGRTSDLLPVGKLKPGRYRLTFDTSAYLSRSAFPAFFPEISIIFEIHDAAQRYHVPLLLSPYGYSTYRGS
jgi:5-hydroxyisourate hydrolase